MQRRKVAPDALDYFPTPPWATRALCEFLRALGEPIEEQEALEPACGELHMVRALREYFVRVRASDVHDYGGHELCDFVGMAPAELETDWLITNPPFRLADAFIRRGLIVARRGVAMLVRSAFLEGAERHRALFRPTPPDYVLQFVERVVMLEGRLIRGGALDPFAADEGTKAKSATAYCWLVWLKGGSGDTRLRWVAPARLRLERADDYPEYRAQHQAIAAAGGLI